MEQHTTRTNTEDQAIDLSVLLRRMGRALTRLWPVCLALVVLCAALMGWRGHRSFRPMYRSDAVFSVNLSFVGGTDVSSYSQYYNKSAAQQVTDNVRARGARPAENGVSSGSGFLVKSDVSKLTKKDRAEIARRAAHGEKIVF